MTQYNFVILRTDKGRRYANKILRSVKWLNENKYPQHEFYTADITIGEFLEDGLTGLLNVPPENTVIHPRCAHPTDVEWIRKLKELENRGYKVVNSVDTIKLTSNKLACSLHLQDKVNHPKSWEYRKEMDFAEFVDLLGRIDESLDGPNFIIAKPLTSIEQGANVKKIDMRAADNLISRTRESFNQVPGSKIVIQEYVSYTALHRVIVIGGKALPYTFVDYADDPRKNGEWKVSCCLNRTTMQLNENAPRELLELAEKTQGLVGGSINFIDIFEYGFPDERPEWPMFTIGEINTACSLNIHEKLAKQAGRNDWNIHFRIAKQLVKELVGE